MGLKTKKPCSSLQATLLIKLYKKNHEFQYKNVMLLKNYIPTLRPIYEKKSTNRNYPLTEVFLKSHLSQDSEILLWVFA